MTGEAGDARTPPIPDDPGIPGPAAAGESGIRTLAARIHDLNQKAAVEYAPLVEGILRSDSRDVRRIEQTLDGLLDFCGYEPVVALYRRSNRSHEADLAVRLTGLMGRNPDRHLAVEPLQEIEQLVGGKPAEMPVQEMRYLRLLNA